MVFSAWGTLYFVALIYPYGQDDVVTGMQKLMARIMDELVVHHAVSK